MIKLLIVVLIALLPLKLLADEKVSKSFVTYEGRWTVNCLPEDNKECVLERSLFLDTEMKKKLITVILQINSTSKDVRFTLISPLGTLIQSGVKIGFDGKFISEKGYGFNICRQIGCITSMMVKKETLEKFKKSKDLNLEYIGGNGQKININFSLKGFYEEYQKIS